jgi:hypothetical protein
LRFNKKVDSCHPPLDEDPLVLGLFDWQKQKCCKHKQALVAVWVTNSQKFSTTQKASGDRIPAPVACLSTSEHLPVCPASRF